jgi:Diacylglycerol kinase catalytic domain
VIARCAAWRITKKRGLALSPLSPWCTPLGKPADRRRGKTSKLRCTSPRFLRSSVGPKTSRDAFISRLALLFMTRQGRDVTFPMRKRSFIQIHEPPAAIVPTTASETQTHTSVEKQCSSSRRAKRSRMRKGLLIHNRKAGSLDVELLPKLISALGEVLSVDIEQLGEAGDALQYAEANHCEWIAAVGGDGTVESVASSLVGTAFPLGVVPAGTFNNFAPVDLECASAAYYEIAGYGTARARCAIG